LFIALYSKTAVTKCYYYVMKETAIDILFLDELTQVPEVNQSFQSNLRVITIFVINWTERILSRGKFAFRCSIIYLWQRKYPL